MALTPGLRPAIYRDRLRSIETPLGTTKRKVIAGLYEMRTRLATWFGSISQKKAESPATWLSSSSRPTNTFD